MTPHELAVKMNVTDGTISQYRKEDGIDPKIDRVSLIAKILQINPVWLLGYSVPMLFEPKLRNPSQEELDLLSAYLNASEEKKDIICSILGIKRANIDSNSLEVG